MSRYLYKTMLGMACWFIPVIAVEVMRRAIDGELLWLVAFIPVSLGFWLCIDLIADIGRED